MTAPTDLDDDRLACDDLACGQGAAVLVLAAAVGFVLTAGWIVRAAYGIAIDPAARAVAGWPW